MLSNVIKEEEVDDNALGSTQNEVGKSPDLFFHDQPFDENLFQRLGPLVWSWVLNQSGHQIDHNRSCLHLFPNWIGSLGMSGRKQFTWPPPRTIGFGSQGNYMRWIACEGFLGVLLGEWLRFVNISHIIHCHIGSPVPWKFSDLSGWLLGPSTSYAHCWYRLTASLLKPMIPKRSSSNGVSLSRLGPSTTIPHLAV